MTLHIIHRNPFPFSIHRSWSLWLVARPPSYAEMDLDRSWLAVSNLGPEIAQTGCSAYGVFTANCPDESQERRNPNKPSPHKVGGRAGVLMQGQVYKDR
jgi:hypothetical protein